MAEVSQLEILFERVEETDSVLADRLRQLMQNYAYDELMALFDPANLELSAVNPSTRSNRSGPKNELPISSISSDLLT